MTQHLQKIISHYEALNQRERYMMLGAIACVFYAVYSFLIEPVTTKKQLLINEINAFNAEKTTIEQELSILSTPNKDQMSSPQGLELKALQSDVAKLDTEINDLKRVLVSPERMPDLLSDLLKNNERLSLIALETQPTVGLFDNDLSAQANQKKINLPVYKHSVVMTIEGRYLDLLSYIEGVEKLPWHVLWDKAALEVEKEPKSQFPLSQIKLTVYTLSLDKNWLSL